MEISPDGKYAAVVTNDTVYGMTEERLRIAQTHTKEPLGMPIFIEEMHGTVTLYDASGKAMFEQSVPEKHVISSNIVVANSGTVALTSEGNIDDQDRDDRLFVFDRNGKKLLVYPGDGEKINGRPEVLHIFKPSSNGRYLAITARLAFPENSKTVFFDLVKHETWKAERSFVVFEKTNEGIAKTSYYDNDEKKRFYQEIDLTKYMGGE